MRKTISQIAFVMTLTAMSTTNIFAASADTTSAAPKTRTWGQYVKQNAAATFTINKAARAAAQAEYQEGSLQVQEAKLAAKLEAEKAKKAQQEENLRRYQETQARIEAARARVGAQQAAIDTVVSARRNESSKMLGGTSTTTLASTIGDTPASSRGVFSRMGLSRKPSRNTSNPPIIAVAEVAKGTVTIGVNDAATRIGPSFEAYLSDKMKRADAIAELMANAKAKGTDGSNAASVVGRIKGSFLNARAKGATQIDVPAAFVR